MQPPPDPAPLLPFADLFADPNFVFGKWGGGDSRDGIVQLPFYAFSKGAQDFLRAVDKGSWVRPDVNWRGDAEGERYHHLCSEPAALETATVDEIALVLTSLVRGDRYSEGILAKAFEERLIQRLLARIEALAGQRHSIEKPRRLVQIPERSTVERKRMNTTKRILISLLIGLAVAGGAMVKDKMTNAEWVVSPEQIAAAKAEGKAGFESSPGTVTVLPIRSEKADILPLTWAIFGIAAAAVSFVVLRRKSA